MNLQGIAAALALIGAICGFGADAAEPESVSTACAVTHPKGGTFGNDSLEVVLPENGKFIFEPGGPGFVDADGALGIKVGWGLHKRGTLVVTGRRLDGVAPPARAYIYRSYDDYIGGMSLALVFPTPGCWEVTGALADASLTFIVQVEKIGDGPSSRMHGLPPGSRPTTRWSGPLNRGGFSAGAHSCGSARALNASVEPGDYALATATGGARDEIEI